MLKEQEKFQKSTLFEGMTSIRAILRAATVDKNPTNTRRIDKILYNCDKLTIKDKNVHYLQSISKELGFSVEGIPESVIDEMALGHSHGGILALCTERIIPRLTKEDIVPNGFYCMIQGIEDPYNFGYALRSLYAAGASGIILPERNWMSAAGVVARASAGASELFRVYTASPFECVSLMRQLGYTIVSADTRTENVLFETELRLPILLLVGGERRGISRELLEKTDMCVKIGYGRDFGASLSASSAATILGYEIFRQNECLHVNNDIHR